VYVLAKPRGLCFYMKTYTSGWVSDGYCAIVNPVIGIKYDKCVTVYTNYCPEKYYRISIPSIYLIPECGNQNLKELFPEILSFNRGIYKAQDIKLIFCFIYSNYVRLTLFDNTYKIYYNTFYTLKFFP
jgi:hypothetical protein